jgi:hypothetical protein
MIIVLIKAILAHVTVLVTQASGSSSLQTGFQFQESQNGNGPAKPETNGINGRFAHISANEHIDNIRTQEVLDKAVSGTLILLLKWFKVSRQSSSFISVLFQLTDFVQDILKFEYVTQLLVDSSYVPLILKLLQLQEIEKVVNFKCEQEELKYVHFGPNPQPLLTYRQSFFYFCRARSRIGIVPEKPANEDDQESDSDDAAPPPIKLRRDNDEKLDAIQEEPPTRVSHPPEVDELGFPTSELPKEPITDFSWRAFFTAINFLRIMQKVCKNKAHRNLMLVSYKSSQFLRKSLKVPQPELRLYTLKLFKNQVPYCGRKWRQSNMRVITAVYLHCRPELRDDWLAGSDVDAEVDESIPLEQALRALTHWHNLKRYPEAMGAREGVLEEEQDFFRRELEKMDWGEEPVEEAQMEQQNWEMQAEGW